MLAFKTIVVAATSGLATWLTALSPEPNDPLYFLVARGSGKCMQQSGASQGNGDEITQSTCANRSNFKLRKIEYGDGSFYLQFAHSGKCLNLAGASWEMLLFGGSSENGVALSQWDCADRSNARWRTRTASDGYVFLVSEASGKCINLHDGTKTDGEAITQWDCARRPDMMWKLVPVR
jgi:Ricin-type beta-trefoil lectin domain-like